MVRLVTSRRQLLSCLDTGLGLCKKMSQSLVQEICRSNCLALKKLIEPGLSFSKNKPGHLALNVRWVNLSRNLPGLVNN